MTTRSLQDLLAVADQVIDALLGTEVTQDDLMHALHKHCPNWTEADQESVITFAQGIAYRISDIGFESCAEEFPQRMAYPIHTGTSRNQAEYLARQTSPARIF